MMHRIITLIPFIMADLTSKTGNVKGPVSRNRTSTTNHSRLALGLLVGGPPHGNRRIIINKPVGIPEWS
jgi:hypothetical protein